MNNARVQVPVPILGQRPNQAQVDQAVGAMVQQVAANIYAHLAAGYLLSLIGDQAAQEIDKTQRVAVLRGLSLRAKAAAPFALEPFGVRFNDLPPYPEPRPDATPAE